MGLQQIYLQRMITDVEMSAPAKKEESDARQHSPQNEDTNDVKQLILAIVSIIVVLGFWWVVG